LGRLIRVERGSLLRLRGEPDEPSAELARWVTMKQAAHYYQVSRPAPCRRTVVREDSAVVTCCARVRRGGIMMVLVVVVPGKTLVP
jgi:hypothetical protein